MHTVYVYIYMHHVVCVGIHIVWHSSVRMILNSCIRISLVDPGAYFIPISPALSLALLLSPPHPISLTVFVCVYMCSCVDHFRLMAGYCSLWNGFERLTQFRYNIWVSVFWRFSYANRDPHTHNATSSPQDAEATNSRKAAPCSLCIATIYEMEISCNVCVYHFNLIVNFFFECPFQIKIECILCIEWILIFWGYCWMGQDFLYKWGRARESQLQEIRWNASDFIERKPQIVCSFNLARFNLVRLLQYD